MCMWRGGKFCWQVDGGWGHGRKRYTSADPSGLTSPGHLSILHLASFRVITGSSRAFHVSVWHQQGHWSSRSRIFTCGKENPPLMPPIWSQSWGITIISYSKLPVKSHDISPLDFYGFRCLKQRRVCWRVRNLKGVWKLFFDECGESTPEKFRIFVDEWKRDFVYIQKFMGYTLNPLAEFIDVTLVSYVIN